MGQELLGCTLSPLCLQKNTMHIAQYGRLSWLQRAGIFIWFTSDLRHPLGIKKGERKIKLYKKMELFRNTRNVSGHLLNLSPSPTRNPN